MAKKSKPVVHPAIKCDIPGCDREAVCGFRRLEDVTSTNDSRVKEFIVTLSTNCCDIHESETAQKYSKPEDIRVPIKTLKSGQYKS